MKNKALHTHTTLRGRKKIAKHLHLCCPSTAFLQRIFPWETQENWMEYRADDNFFLFLCSRVRILGANELKDKMSLKLVGAISPTFIFWGGEKKLYWDYWAEERQQTHFICSVICTYAIYDRKNQKCQVLLYTTPIFSSKWGHFLVWGHVICKGLAQISSYVSTSR